MPRQQWMVLVGVSGMAALVGCSAAGGNPEPILHAGVEEEDTRAGEASQISRHVGQALGARVVMNADGHAVVVWYEYDSERSTVWSNRYQPISGWDTPVQLGAGGDTLAGPSVAIDDQGNALAVWDERTEERVRIWANRYEPDRGWSGGEVIAEEMVGALFFPQVAMNDAGSSWIVWRSGDASSGIRALKYDTSAGFGSIETLGSGSAELLDVGIGVGEDGVAVAMWSVTQQAPLAIGSVAEVWANHYDPGAGWGVATPLPDASSMSSPQVVMTVGGAGAAAWVANAHPNPMIEVGRYDPSSGWRVNDLPLGSHGPGIVIDGAGNTLVTWTPAPGAESVFATRIEAADGSITSQAIAAGESQMLAQRLAGNSAGEAVAVWYQSATAGGDIFAARYRPGQGWEKAAAVTTGQQLCHDCLAGASPEVAVDEAGQAIVIWAQLHEEHIDLKARVLSR